MQNVNFLVFGLLLIAFAISFAGQMHGVVSRGWRGVSSGLLLLTGLAMAASGLFRLHTTPLIETLHQLCFLVVFSSLVAAQLILGMRWVLTPTWRGFGWYTLLNGFLSVGAFLAFATLADPLNLDGLFQRFLVVIAFSWYVVTGCRLFASR